MPSAPPPAEASFHPRVGRARWSIVAVLFAATAINHVDRQMIGLLKPTLQSELGWTEATYADIVFFFQLSYAIGLLVFGALIDRIGARPGYAIAFVVWTAAHMLHGAVGSVAGFAAVRALLGAGESGNFPAGLKAVSEWFPRRERAFATGLFNAGANVGAIVTPLVVPAITLAFGWRMALVITGGVSLIWLVAGPAIYRSPRRSPRVGAAELALIESDPHDPVARVVAPAADLPRDMGDRRRQGYVVADLGSIGGGWLSSRLLHRGWSVNAARKLTMLLCALAVVPIVLALWMDGLRTAVAIIALAMAAHQGGRPT